MMRGAILTAIALLGTVFFAVPAAHAADVGILACVSQGSDYACYSGGTATVCDEEADGRRVYGLFKQSGGATLSVEDTDNANGRCINSSIPNVVQFQVCEGIPDSADACSSWVRL